MRDCLPHSGPTDAQRAVFPAVVPQRGGSRVSLDVRRVACLALVLVCTASQLVPSVVYAEENPDADACATPRSAADTWLSNLPPNGNNAARAIACFDWERAEVGGEERQRRAKELKQVLDLGGHWVDMDEMSNAADGDGDSRVELPVRGGRFPEIYFVKHEDRWLMSARSIRAIPRLYETHVNTEVESFLQGLPAWMRSGPADTLAWWQVFGLVALLGLGLLVRGVVTVLLSRYVASFIRHSGLRADGTIVEKSARPLGTLAFAGLIWYVLPLLRLTARLNVIGLAVVRVMAGVAVVMMLYRIADLVSDVFERRAAKTDTKLDDQLVPLLRKTAKTVVVGFGIIFVLQNMDVDVTSLVAVGSLATLGFSLAAQDTVSNLFGSLSIFADRPFQIGDWVVVGGVEGVVEEVGMRSTRIRTFYNSVVTMPNSKVTVTPVDNYGARQYRRTNVSVGLTYSTTPEQMQAFCEGCRAILKANPKVRKDYYEVHFKGFGESSLDVMLYFFFEVDSWSEELRQRHNVYLEIMRLARELGVDFAFPTRTLHVATQAEATALPKASVPSEGQMVEAVQSFGPDGGRSRPMGPKLTAGYFAGGA